VEKARGNWLTASVGSAKNTLKVQGRDLVSAGRFLSKMQGNISHRIRIINDPVFPAVQDEIYNFVPCAYTAKRQDKQHDERERREKVCV